MTTKDFIDLLSRQRAKELAQSYSNRLSGLGVIDELMTELKDLQAAESLHHAMASESGEPIVAFEGDEILSYLKSIYATLAQVQQDVQSLIIGGQKMDVVIAALQAQVAQNTAVEASAVTLIQGIATQLQAFANDPTQITALSAQLQQSAAALAAAVAANTTPVPAPSASAVAGS